MADQVKDTTSLKLDFLFVDGDTRSLTLKNPKSTVSTSDIESLQTFMRTSNVVIGDRDGGTFGRIDKVTKVTERKVYLDYS